MQTKQNQEQWLYSRSLGKTMDIKSHLNTKNISISYFHHFQAENSINYSSALSQWDSIMFSHPCLAHVLGLRGKKEEQNKKQKKKNKRKET